jgi:hypothetical protein
MAMSTIIFDLGGVVCRYQPELRLQELARIYGRAPEDVRRVLYESGFIGETELGYWNAEQIVLVGRAGAEQLVGVQHLADVVKGGRSQHRRGIDGHAGVQLLDPGHDLRSHVVHGAQVGGQPRRRVQLNQELPHVGR